MQNKLKRQYRLRLVLTATASAVLLVGMVLFLLAKAYYWDWKVETWVKEAASAWQYMKWPEALEALQRAHRRPENASVQELHSRIAIAGGPDHPDSAEGLEMEIFPTTKPRGRWTAAAELLLAKGHGSARERGFAGVGHWWVKIYRPGREPGPALVYIGQVRASQDTGWKETDTSRPGDPDLSFPPREESRARPWRRGVIDPLVCPPTSLSRCWRGWVPFRRNEGRFLVRSSLFLDQ